MIVHFQKDFKKELRALPKKHQEQFLKRLDVFLKNPHHPILNNHKLGGKLQGRRSINVTGDIRAIYEEISKDAVLFLMIGSHNKLYG